MSDADPPQRKSWRQHPGWVGLILLVVIVAVVTGVLFWRHARAHEKTDDAYVDAISELVSPQISGRVVRVLVNDNEDVAAGQVLVELDSADLQARLQQVEAARAQALAQKVEAQAQESVSGAQVEQARAALGTAEANATNASNQLKRYRDLKAINAGAVSGQQMDSAVAAEKSTAAQLIAAGKSVAAAEAQIGYARSLIEAANAGIGSAQAQIAQAQLTLSYAHVRTRVAGRVASKTVSEGNYVQSGAVLMAVVPREIYVTANFKETQLRRMRPHQPVTIKVDSYPDMKLTGTIEGVQPATGQAFSLLPAQNATGNWVKVVQRIPVKVRLDKVPEDGDRRLGPGMSVEVSVTVR